MLNKKAAMFGLDARIALAIFGALSVITGAALYKSIQNAKVISVLNQMEELSKAVDSYRLDTGSLPVVQGVPNASGYFSITSNIGEIIENTKNVHGWKGPYIAMNKNSLLSLLFDKNYNASLHAYNNRTAGYSVNANMQCHKKDENCNLYIKLQYDGSDKAQAVNLFNNLEKYIDGSLDDLSFRTGKIRFSQSSSTTDPHYLDPDASGYPAIFYFIGPYPRNHLK